MKIDQNCKYRIDGWFSGEILLTKPGSKLTGIDALMEALSEPSTIRTYNIITREVTNHES